MTIINRDVKADLTTAADTYHAALLAGNNPAKQYLVKRFGSPEYAHLVAVAYRLGYVETPAVGHERFRGRLVIPYVTRSGVINLKARCIRCTDKCDGHPKYDGPAGLGAHLYNAQTVLDPMTDTIVICEGEVDAMTLDACIGVNAVAIPGVSSWKGNASAWGILVGGFARIIFVADGDAAGKQAAEEMNVYLPGRVRSLTMPDGEDVNSYYLKAGADAVKARLGIKE